MARFLLDEMLTGVIGDQLEATGHDCTAIHRDPELRSLADEQVLELATAQQRILITRNIDDFVHLDRMWKQFARTHCGIILVPNKTFPENRSFIGSVVKALQAAEGAAALPKADELVFLTHQG